VNKQTTSNRRVSLEREILINLRQEKELLAIICAEKRLYVSIASIKRAETGKNILYRTTRDIARQDPHVRTIYDPSPCQACEETTKLGVKVTREAGPMKHGTTVIAFVEDPDGYKIEFIQKKTT